MCDPIIVNPAVKMRPHPVAHPHQPLITKYPPLPRRAPKAFVSLQALFEGLIFGYRLQNSPFFVKISFSRRKVSARDFCAKCTSLTACLYSTFALAPRLLFGHSYEKDRLFFGLIWIRLLIRREVGCKAHLINVQVISLWYLLN